LLTIPEAMDDSEGYPGSSVTSGFPIRSGMTKKSMLSKEEVIKISQLARIELSEQEVEKFQKDLSTVLDYVEELKKVDTEGLEEIAQVTGLENVQREDVAIMTEYRDEILSQAPEIKDGYYKVKAIL
jgi:aspartyl-tRNA(Asn)/glutamyl-tRNA(Gln) amidotransferase subunit C